MSIWKRGDVWYMSFNFAGKHYQDKGPPGRSETETSSAAIGKPIGTLASEAPTAHGIAVASSGEVYVAQLSGVVQKFVRK